MDIQSIGTHGADELLEIACEIMQWPTPRYKIKEQKQQKKSQFLQVKCSIRWKETARDTHCIFCAKNEAVGKILKYLIGRPGMALTFRQLRKENKPINFDTVKLICKTNGLGTAQMKCSLDSPYYVASCVILFHKAYKRQKKNKEVSRTGVAMAILAQMPRMLLKSAVDVLNTPVLEDSRSISFCANGKNMIKLMSMAPHEFEDEDLNHVEFLNDLVFEQRLRAMYFFYCWTTTNVDCKCTIRIPGSGKTIEEQSNGTTKRESIASVSRKVLYRLWEFKTANCVV